MIVSVINVYFCQGEVGFFGFFGVGVVLGVVCGCVEIWIGGVGQVMLLL